ncbi:MAG: acetylornithine deacetylase [Erythrobacter sp.]|uniref:acetylornithine deacetylase n=1 Tax=Erythrobacter sp. TaxID=1042 RepID=UPI0032985442
MTNMTHARAILDRLIAFDTTSRNSNLALIEWVESYLSEYGVTGHRVANEDGTKSNLFATIGPMVEGGVILSGHTDVVPVDNQDWSSDPWITREESGKLYGRGTADMKSFIALALAWVPEFAKGAKPIHLAISYDEEIGCLGAPAMIEQMRTSVRAPRLAVVGEPTSMRLVTGHKGISVYKVEVQGAEAHSSLVNHGISANEHAVDLMHSLVELSRELKAKADPDNGFDPPYPTLTIGVMQGGEAANILAGHAQFQFDLRCPPGFAPDELLAPFKALCEALDKELSARFPQAGASFEKLADAPPLSDDGSDDAIAFVQRLTGENMPPAKVSYGAEAGQFQQGGFPTVICGPGSIEQAHQPNEWIALEQLEQGTRFMERLAQELA